MQLKGFEMLKAIILDPTPFSIERDLITPTFKLKRPQLLKYYKVSKKVRFDIFFFNKEHTVQSTGNCTSCPLDLICCPFFLITPNMILLNFVGAS
jgi:hypothetical protein